MKFLKVGRVAIITRGRYAGKKVRLFNLLGDSPLLGSEEIGRRQKVGQGLEKTYNGNSEERKLLRQCAYELTSDYRLLTLASIGTTPYHIERKKPFRFPSRCCDAPRFTYSAPILTDLLQVEISRQLLSRFGPLDVFKRPQTLGVRHPTLPPRRTHDPRCKPPSPCRPTSPRANPFPYQVVIIQPVDNGNKPHPFGHAVVAGIERYPSKITRRMSKTRQEKRSKVKPFIKVINYNHLMPTRYTLELEGLKGSVTADTFKEVSQREDAKKTVKKALEDRYTSGKNRWFFTPLMRRGKLSSRYAPSLANYTRVKVPKVDTFPALRSIGLLSLQTVLQAVSGLHREFAPDKWYVVGF
ncbi:60S ribosomal protein L27-A [Beauveria bassiana D1-5]|uniref:60S ribosomal protein L27-A n=1 Tax=Beauveria bassiana D1-5 TaxID=1245745 RepID=A0A0A2VMN8_BEABA|nr:60S ribosomal protein L27-A [Beauveria bassiana D1-5]